MRSRDEALKGYITAQAEAYYSMLVVDTPHASAYATVHARMLREVIEQAERWLQMGHEHGSVTLYCQLAGDTAVMTTATHARTLAALAEVWFQEMGTK